MDDGLMIELAACRHAVGIALFADPVVLELRGSDADLDWVARALTGASPCPGRGADASWGWWIRTARQRADLVADAASGAALRRALSATTGTSADVAARDKSPECALVVVAGPRAASVLAAGVERLPRPALAAVHCNEVSLLLLPADLGPASRDALLAAGRPRGALAVGSTAVATIRAADRISARQRPTHAPEQRSASIESGA